VVIPVRDRADVIGRAVVGVLAQTFADVEVVVVDDGSVDDTVAAAHAVADHRVRVVRRPLDTDTDADAEVGSDDGREVRAPAPGTARGDACRVGLEAARGRWALLLDPDTEVAASWLARLGRLADATGAGFVSCGGEHHHLDGSTTEITPTPAAARGVPPACLRPGAFAAATPALVDAASRADAPGAIGEEALRAALDRGARVAHTPELLVAWFEPPPDGPAEGDELRLRWAFQGLEAMARTPIPDGELLARYATIGGVAAARLRRGRDARLLFRIACRARPDVHKHWARLAVSHVSPLSRRVWDPADAAATDVGSALEAMGAVSAGAGAGA
jgi:glycosyltransferase involved in cell wall biosynthesis